MNEARLCQDLSNPWTILSSPSFGVHTSTTQHTLSKLPAAYSDLHYVGQYFQVEFLTIIGIPNGVHWIDWVIHIKKKIKIKQAHFLGKSNIMLSGRNK